jgi:RHS repeat-associated protein
MPTVRYTVVDGEVLSELRGGVKRDYVPDPLGSTVALLDSSQAKTDTFQYWPYGESAGRTGTTATPFQYIGVYGGYTTNNRIYFRKRFYRHDLYSWNSEDREFSNESLINLYKYSWNSPLVYIDTNGLYPQRPGKHPCKTRTEKYCDTARNHDCKNRAENCFCRVSGVVCNLIVNDSGIPYDGKVKLDCINRCMFNNWEKRGRRFPDADRTCKQSGLESNRCCASSIYAEQEGLTHCKNVVCKNIGHGRIPSLGLLDPEDTERNRIGRAIGLCCHGDIFGEPLTKQDQVNLK